jgi:hypothetical protein
VRGLQQMRHLMNDNVFEALLRLSGEIGIQSNRTRAVIATTPFCLHSLNEEASHRRCEQEVNYFGNFSGLCAPISGCCVPSVLISETRLQNARAKNGRIYRGLLARPKRFELLTPRFVVWCSIPVLEGPPDTAARKKISVPEVVPDRARDLTR